MAKVYAMFIVSRDGIPLFTRNLAGGKIHPDLVTSFLTAMGSFMSEISPTSAPALRRVEAQGFTIMIEAGEQVFGALLVDKEDTMAREYLRAMVVEFERMFGDRLSSWDGDVSLFETFGGICDRMMSIIAIGPYHIPRLGSGGLSDRIVVPRDLWSVLRLVDGRRTVAEIADEAGIDVGEAIRRLRRLAEEGLVDVPITEPVEKVARAYLEAFNSYLSLLRELVGASIAASGLRKAVSKWDLGWLAESPGPGVEARELNRLAWLHTPGEVSDMFRSFLEALHDAFRPLLGALAGDLRARVEAEMEEEHGEELRRLGAWGR
ncbi:hypothetical protein DRO32_04290 [Candidatus Bathyarchaeota archaeon]|nr:MAG: hypothetical protein DRO32_04290 [Candidatus Bathyarchaeota archaeon]